MRKAERECNTENFYAEVFNNSDELYIAFNTGTFPYIIPVNYVYTNNALYFHCATEGTKLDLLAKDARVAFSTATGIAIDRKKSTTYYKSVCGTGQAVLVEDNAEKIQALDSIALRYTSQCPRPTPPGMLGKVAIVRIDILEISGKKNLPCDNT